MKSDGAPVAVVGGGFSGVMTAVQLARLGVPSMLFDGSGRMGRGVAYSTREAVHLLNVPSASMSAWPDRPEDFASWLGDDGSSFAPRQQFGSYLQQILSTTDGVACEAERVVAADRTDAGWRLRLGDGRSVESSALVLANGNQPPADMAVGADLPSHLFIHNPWSEEAHSAVERAAASGGDVLLIGTGLTMVDTVLSLDAAGHRGRILALSRRGLAPRPHAVHERVPVEADQVPHGDLLALWRWVRRRSGEVGYRAAVDSLRPFSQSLWRSFSAADKGRFLRHGRPWWDVHRHRIAPQVGRQIADQVAGGRMEIMAGRLRGVRREGEGLLATIARRGGRTEERRFSVAFNCTGPLGEMRRTQDPLLRQLLDEGAITIDGLGMGLAVENCGKAGDRLWAVGPMTKGAYWEIVAVPDIRGQVAQVAEEIAKELRA